MIDHPEVAEARRPGITKLCERMAQARPDWSREQCVAEAKRLYHTPTITSVEGREIINPDYLAGRDR